MHQQSRSRMSDVKSSASQDLTNVSFRNLPLVTFLPPAFIGLLLTCNVDWLNDYDFTQQVSSEINILVHLLTLDVLYQRLVSNQGVCLNSQG